MALIKLQDGKVITKDGKVSCDCCICQTLTCEARSVSPVWGLLFFQIEFENLNIYEQTAQQGLLYLQGGSWKLTYDIDAQIVITRNMYHSSNPSQPLAWDYDIRFSGTGEETVEQDDWFMPGNSPRACTPFINVPFDELELIDSTVDLIVPDPYVIDGNTYGAETRRIFEGKLTNSTSAQILAQIIDCQQQPLRSTLVVGIARSTFNWPPVETTTNAGTFDSVDFGYAFGTRVPFFGDVAPFLLENTENTRFDECRSTVLGQNTIINQTLGFVAPTTGPMTTTGYTSTVAAKIQCDWEYIPPAP